MKDELSHYVDPHTDSVLPVGTILSGGKFTVTGHIGIGGFGVTYRATDNVLGRTIVIKECFTSDFCERDGNTVVARNANCEPQMRSIVELFMREARSLAKLRHPNIVGVHSAFEENGTAYMALDLINGPDLLCLLDERNTTFAPKVVKKILDQLLQAIDEVHALDLLHRDISPDNIIIEKSGNPVLIDFGAARGDASRRTRAISSIHVVKDGYSPQEFYVAGSMQTPSSDIYALGATMYHLLSGEAPPNSQARMFEIAGSKPDPCVPLVGRVAGYEPSFLAAVDRAMSIHPSERFQSAQEWREIIAAITPKAAKSGKPAQPVQPAEKIAPAPVRPAAAEPMPDIELSLSKLVQETNEAVRKTRVLQREASPPQPAEQPKKSKQQKTTILGPGYTPEPEPQPAPVTRSEVLSVEPDDAIDAPKPRAVSRPSRPKSQGQARTRVLYTTPEATQAETNWIMLAQERQELQRKARASELEMQSMQAKAKRSMPFPRSKDRDPTPTQVEIALEPTHDFSSLIMRYLSAGIGLGVLAIVGIGWAFPNAIPGL